MTEPDLGRTQSDRSSRQWVKLAITLVLLVAVIAAGTAARFILVTSGGRSI
jgi:hypothetical protein